MSAQPRQLILIEDDERLGPLVVRHLQESGFEVDWVKTASEADAVFGCRRPDLAIVDLMLPGEDGLSLCRRLRRDADLGIIIVTARGEEADRILGLELGADDYVPKPFSLWELEARVRAVLRRCARNGASTDALIRIGSIAIDLDRRQATRNGAAVDLTRSEFDLLATLMSKPGAVFSRERLLDCVLGGGSDAYDRAVDTHVSNLRKKLESDSKSPRQIKTVWGVGYRFDP